MIAKVIEGMRTFLGVLLITIIAFADGFVSLQDEQYPLALTEEDNFFTYIGNGLHRFLSSCFYTYKMTLGDFSIDDFDSEHKFIAAILIVICTMFVMIIMLNLLISIIGSVYSSVQDNQVNEFY